MGDVIGCDIEVYRNFFFIGFRRFSDGKTRRFELSDRSALDTKTIIQIFRQNTIVTFNGLPFDVPLIMLALDGATNVELKEAADRIIVGRLKPWDVEEALGVTIPRAWDIIDLIEPQPNAFASLKTLAGRMHAKRLQDLPYKPEAVLTHEQMDQTIDYCLNSDLVATGMLYDALGEPLEMRIEMGKEVGLDLRSKSDTRMGMAIIKKRVEEITGHKVKKGDFKPGASFKFKAPEYIQFQTPKLQEMLRRIEAHTFIVGPKGKAELPDFLADDTITIDSDIRSAIAPSAYQMGLGGLHSTEAKRCVLADDDHAMVDADVAAYYPAIIITRRLCPPGLGEAFLIAYSGIRTDRLAAKKAKRKARDKGLKISLNGAFGDTSNPYSIIYSPKMTISITLTGQLSLLMLIERAELEGIQVVSANTDGVVFRVPREHFDGIENDRLNGEGLLAEITGDWEAATGFDLEFVEYRGLYSASVNNYMAVKADGKVKRKGPIANPWFDKPEWGCVPDTREQLMKNPQMGVCADAALGYILEGIPVEKTIRDCRDIRHFVTVIKESKGATWRGEYLGKVVRYIWAKDGEPIYSAEPNAQGTHKKTPKSDGARPVMTLPDEFPDDIDYDHYIAEAKDILVEIGAREPIPVYKRRKRRPPRHELIAYAVAA